MEPIVREMQNSYHHVAAKYAQRYQDEMDHKPFDQDCLDHLTREVGHLGLTCDLGCGRGKTARYLDQKGVRGLGMDLASKMVADAKSRNDPARQPPLRQWASTYKISGPEMRIKAHETKIQGQSRHVNHLSASLRLMVSAVLTGAIHNFNRQWILDSYTRRSGFPVGYVPLSRWAFHPTEDVRRPPSRSMYFG